MLFKFLIKEYITLFIKEDWGKPSPKSQKVLIIDVEAINNKNISVYAESLLSLKN
ncbi:hypothetical protein EV05_0115 [Prochlorococcus sp. MIT 0601]|nr:hypothetical protein EV05_0115 [Prochlorococcus sp. MIT 0601]